MKKLVVFFLALGLLFTMVSASALELEQPPAVGDIITFGAYEQDGNEENGKEPVEWIVMEVQADKALLLTRYGIDTRAYHTRFVPMTWEKCELRNWMNTTMLDSLFSAEEQAMLCKMLLSNPKNPGYHTSGGADTEDILFLLSLSEAETYFPVESERPVAPTAYAKAQGAFVDATNGNGWWMLRSPGVRKVDICGVRADGRISGYGSRDVNRPRGLLRPAVWVKLGE